jgi:uncharacterized protein (TIGR03437 family)
MAWIALPLLTSVLRGEIGNIVVTSAASFQRGMPAKGSIGTIFCTGLRVEGLVSAPGVPLPTELAGVTVVIGGASAPLFAVADLGGYQLINFQVPHEAKFDLDGTVQVAVRQNGTEGLGTALNDANAPGELFRTGETELGAFQHASDYSLVTVDNPARVGEVIIAYGTGLRTAVPTVPTGQLTPASPLSRVPQYDRDAIDRTGLVLAGNFLVQSEAMIAGTKAIQFLGLAPGTVGVYQCNFEVPQGTSPGNLAVQLMRVRCDDFPGVHCGALGATRYYRSQTVLLPVR